MKQMISECIREFAESEYSISRGKKRSESTTRNYKALARVILDFLGKEDFDIYEFDLSSVNPTTERRRYKRRVKQWERLANTIKKQSRDVSERTLKLRLDFMSNVLRKAENDYAVVTGRKYFKYQVKDGGVTVINTELFKRSVKIARAICLDKDYSNKRTQLGAFTFLLCAYTSARIGDIRNFRYSQNFSFGSSTGNDTDHPSYLTYRNRKTKSKNITIKLPKDLVEVILAMESDSDYLLRGASEVTIRYHFKDFLMSIPDYNISSVRTRVMASGKVKTESLKLYDIITPHKVRATFITQMIENGVDLETVMSFSGHTDIRTLSTRYTNVSDAHKEKQYSIYTAIFG